LRRREISLCGRSPGRPRPGSDWPGKTVPPHRPSHRCRQSENPRRQAAWALALQPRPRSERLEWSRHSSSCGGWPSAWWR
jgi:hypothetical protein